VKIAISGLPKEAAKPFARIIDRTADATGFDDATVLRIATYLYQFKADEIAMGSVVTIPGWGAYGVWLDERFRTRTTKRVVFSPAAGLKAHVSLTCPETRRPKKKLAYHRRNNGFNPDTNYTHKRPWSTMDEIRAAIDSQMAES